MQQDFLYVCGEVFSTKHWKIKKQKSKIERQMPYGPPSSSKGTEHTMPRMFYMIIPCKVQTQMIIYTLTGIGLQARCAKKTGQTERHQSYIAACAQTAHVSCRQSLWRVGSPPACRQSATGSVASAIAER